VSPPDAARPRREGEAEEQARGTNSGSSLYRKAVRANGALDDWAEAQAAGGETADRVASLRVLSEAEVVALPQPEWLIDGLLVAGSLAAMYGRPGSGKTFLALSIAKSVASGNDFIGHAVRQTGPVLYVAAEDVHGVGQRVEAWNAHDGTRDGHDVSFVGEAINVANLASVDMLSDAVESVGADLLVVDTFARCTVGVEENSSRDVGQVVALLDRLRNRTGAAVLLVRHSGKDVTRGSRGSNALLGAVDTELECVDGLLRVTKQKSAQEGRPTGWKLEPAASSVVPVPRRREDVEHDKSRRDDVLEALRRICPTGDTVSSGVWQDTSAEVGLDRSTFYAHKKALLEAGLVDQSGDGRSTRFAPRASSESNPLRDGGGVGRTHPRRTVRGRVQVQTVRVGWLD
jgi:KaiC/GvpD/RAD55 family RecA-like ATPase